MNFFEKILNALDGRMTCPTMYGWFHLLALAVIISLIVFLCIKFKNSNDKTVRIILLVLSSIMILFEIYKQLNYSYNGATDTWDYQWYAFPFQFCSTPMYVALIASLIPKGKVQDAMYCFLATYGLFGGLSVMLYPADVFIGTIGINIQTMIHHGFQIVMGVYLLVSGRVDFKIKTSWKTLLKASIVFVSLTLIALLADVIVVKAGITETFNMFYISPYYACSLPLLSALYPVLPYFIFLIVYMLGFALCAYIMLLLAKAISLITPAVKKIFKKSNSNQTQNE